MGMCHVKGDLYVAGGSDETSYWKMVRRITAMAETCALKEMPVAKGYFPLVLWTRKKALIAIGGYNGESLSETMEYSMGADRWSALPCLPFPVDSSSGVILGGVHLYNLGGLGSSCSALHLQLGSASPRWKKLDVANCNFEGWTYRGAAVVGGLIVYFGNNKSETTYVLEKKEGGTGLRLAGKHAGFNYKEAGCDRGFTTYKGALYAFPKNTYHEVWHFDPHQPTWVQHF